ncbi:MAG: T9SS type A sorting domain-containing protein [Bacteroidia bacterium]|nr:T9SS type A sorting domain-containing protein [Bacteroidia bacterium]
MNNKNIGRRPISQPPPLQTRASGGILDNHINLTDNYNLIENIVNIGFSDFFEINTDYSYQLYTSNIPLAVFPSDYVLYGQPDCIKTPTSYLCGAPETKMEETNPDSSISSNLNLSLFPNPSSGLFSILIEGTEKDIVMEISDVSGRVFERVKATLGLNKIDFLGHNNGIYFCKLFNKSNLIGVKKIVIIK